ncbi:hypothetical protein B0H12DRAFT_1327617 [Mycena haematopus]|nr:hypothetical protein B0H12DRAFT_1327617 [Mycena haematopus]
MNSVIPFKFPRIITLFLAWAWSIISLAVGINAFIKSNRDKNRLKNQVPPPATISINTNDVFRAGVVVTVISGLILVLTTVYIVLTVTISARTLRLQYISLAFLAVWLFAAQIPVSLFVATRSAKVSAFIDGFPISDGVLQTIEQAIGAKTAYKDFNYLKLVAILPWFTFLFTLAAAIVIFLASSRSRSKASTAPTAETKSAQPTTAV